MTSKLNNEIGTVNISKMSLTERIRQITSVAMVAGSLLLGASAEAAIPRQSSVVSRALAVQSVLNEKIAADASAADKLPRAQELLAQWGNSWANWNNWNNWHNFSNWINWGNF